MFRVATGPYAPPVAHAAAVVARLGYTGRGG